MNPRILNAVQKGYQKSVEDQDRMNWMAGQYQMSAVLTALDKALNGKKSKAEYLKKPLFELISDELKSNTEENEDLAMRLEIQKMEQWIANDRRRGIPETKI